MPVAATPLGGSTNHPSSELIAAYVSGALALGPSVVVGSHLDGCAFCLVAASALEEIEGARFLSLEDAPLRAGALEQIMRRLDEVLPETPTAAEGGVGLLEGFRLPDVVAAIGLVTPIHLTADAWVAHLDAPRVDGWRTYLFSAPPNTALPDHGHGHDEMIAILEGGFYDGRHFAAGDFTVNAAGTSHQMTVSPGSRFVALIASGAPLEWQPADRGIGTHLDI